MDSQIDIEKQEKNEKIKKLIAELLVSGFQEKAKKNGINIIFPDGYMEINIEPLTTEREINEAKPPSSIAEICFSPMEIKEKERSFYLEIKCTARLTL